MSRHPTTASQSAPRPFHTAHATCAAVQRQGTRDVQADAYAVLRDPRTGRIAAAVADGIGDTEDAAWIARVGADQAAAIAVRHGSATRAVREARAHRNWHQLFRPDYNPDWDPWPGEADTVLAVAVIQPGASTIRVAWAGDCRVYRLGHTGVMEQVTTDHTSGEELRQMGFLDRDAPLCRADNVVTSRLAHGAIGTAAVPVELTRRLLLCSDGISKQLDATAIGLNLATAEHAAEAADWLATDADVPGTDNRRTRSDNITAVVIDLAQHPTGRNWRPTRHR